MYEYSTSKAKKIQGAHPRVRIVRPAGPLGRSRPAGQWARAGVPTSSPPRPGRRHLAASDTAAAGVRRDKTAGRDKEETETTPPRWTRVRRRRRVIIGANERIYIGLASGWRHETKLGAWRGELLAGVGRPMRRDVSLAGLPGLARLALWQ